MYGLMCQCVIRVSCYKNHHGTLNLTFEALSYRCCRCRLVCALDVCQCALNCIDADKLSSFTGPHVAMLAALPAQEDSQPASQVRSRRRDAGHVGITQTRTFA